MGWREFRAWRRELVRTLDLRAGRTRTDPDSWDGQQNDPWWEEQRRKAREG